MRQTAVYDLKDLPYNDDGKLLIQDVSTVRIHLPGYTYPVDLGSFCYTQRRKTSTDYTSEKCSLTKVVISSFQEKRKNFIEGVLDYMSNYILLEKSKNSIKSSYGQLLFFIRWCDENYIQGLDDINNCKIAMSGYTDHLIHRVRTSDININTAATYQLVAISITSSAFNDKYGDITNGLRKIRRSYNASNVTTPPEKEDATFLINTYFSLFKQLSTFILNFEKFPKDIVVNDESYWFFPNSLPIVSHRNHIQKQVLKTAFFAYDYKNGVINSVEQIAKRIYRKNSNIIEIYKIAERTQSIAKNKISVANSKEFHHSRIFAATLSMQSFVMLFCAHTGMNLGQVASTKWSKSGDYDIGLERQGFKNIKYRANNKPVSFYISSSFLKVFKKYLELRKYLLNSLEIEEYKYLFFKIASNKAQPLGMSISTFYHERINRLFGIEEKITTRQWRSFKSDWLIKNTNIINTSLILQNSPRTVLKHYIEGSKTESESELTSYYENLESIVIDHKNSFTKSLNIGNCIDYKNPETIDNEIENQPNCQNTKGCLFCNKYAVHADATDIKKLYSYKYVILQTRILSDSNETFDKVNSKVIQRIDKILQEIMLQISLPIEEINTIKEDIFIRENLSIYWSRKLEMLIELELI